MPVRQPSGSERNDLGSGLGFELVRVRRDVGQDDRETCSRIRPELAGIGEPRERFDLGVVRRDRDRARRDEGLYASVIGEESGETDPVAETQTADERAQLVLTRPSTGDLGLELHAAPRRERRELRSSRATPCRGTRWPRKMIRRLFQPSSGATGSRASHAPTGATCVGAASAGASVVALTPGLQGGGGQLDAKVDPLAAECVEPVVCAREEARAEAVGDEVHGPVDDLPARPAARCTQPAARRKVVEPDPAVGRLGPHRERRDRRRT